MPFVGRARLRVRGRDGSAHTSRRVAVWRQLLYDKPPLIPPLLPERVADPLDFVDRPVPLCYTAAAPRMAFGRSRRDIRCDFAQLS